MMKQWLIGAALGVLPLLTFAERLPVVASFSIIADMTRQIGGDRVDVVSLVGPNKDIHVFQPTTADVKYLSKAKVFVINGLGLEGWIPRLSKSAHFKGTQIDATEGVAPILDHHDHDHDHEHHHQVDPHAWHDPQCVQKYIHNIVTGLIKADPAGEAYYRQRAATFSARVKNLDQQAAAAFAAIPESRRKVVTAHDAFAYLGHRYAIRFLAPQGMGSETDASAKNVAQLIRQLRQEKVKAVFFEKLADERLLKQIANEAGVKVDGKLYYDTLSEPGKGADTWENMFRYNIKTIQQSFQ